MIFAPLITFVFGFFLVVILGGFFQGEGSTTVFALLYLSSIIVAAVVYFAEASHKAHIASMKTGMEIKNLLKVLVKHQLGDKWVENEDNSI